MKNPETAADFVKIVRPGQTRCGASTPSVFCKIEFNGGRLSITGVEGPTSNGDAIGSCGQIVMHLREQGAAAWATFAEGWDAERVARFLDVWDAWHLNDMRAYDAEMKAAGWPEIAARPILKFEFSLTREAFDAKRAAVEAAGAALRKGETFTPTPEQVADATRPYSLEVYAYPEQDEPDAPEGYERSRYLAGSRGLNPDVKAPERKTLGWVKPSEHPDGLLTRKLRPDGPGYGSAWFREDVPADVLDFLRALPDADRTPAWV